MSAAMQRARRSEELDQAIRRLETLLSVDARELRLLLTSSDAPLGPARRLLTLDDESQVRVTPDDDRCVAAEVLAAADDGCSRIQAELYAVSGRVGS